MQDLINEFGEFKMLVFPLSVIFIFARYGAEHLVFAAGEFGTAHGAVTDGKNRFHMV